MSVGMWDWIPRTSVGPFRFGSNASDVIARFGLRRLEPDCIGAFWDTYEIPGHRASITTESNKITSVSCNERLYYMDTDILQFELHAISSILGPAGKSEPHPYLDGTLVVYYNDLGLTLFAEGEYIDSVICYDK